MVKVKLDGKEYECEDIELVGMAIGILIFTYKYYIPIKERIKELEWEVRK